MDISSIDTWSKRIAGLRIAVLAISCVCAAISVFEQEYTLACFWALMIVACQLERVLGRLVISKDS